MNYIETIFTENFNKLQELENEFFDSYKEALFYQNKKSLPENKQSDTEQYFYYLEEYESIVKIIKAVYKFLQDLNPEFEYEFETELQNLLYNI